MSRQEGRDFVACLRHSRLPTQPRKAVPRINRRCTSQVLPLALQPLDGGTLDRITSRSRGTRFRVPRGPKGLQYSGFGQRFISLMHLTTKLNSSEAMGTNTCCAPGGKVRRAEKQYDLLSEAVTPRVRILG